MFQETHFSLNDEKQWKDQFNGPLFFSHGKTNSCGVATGFCGKNSFDLIDQKSDKNGFILIIEAKINEDNFIVINIHNSNTESEQLKTVSILQNMPDDSFKQMFLHLSPLTIHQFFSHLKKEMALLVEEDYGSLISL